MVEERTVITRTLCASCETELVEHTFTQERKAIWPTNQQLEGWTDELDAETSNQQLDGWPDERAGEDPNLQRAGQEEHLSSFVPQVAGWGVQAAEHTGADPATHPDPHVVPGAGASLLDDVANLPGVRAGLIAPGDPYFASLQTIASHDGLHDSRTDGVP